MSRPIHSGGEPVAVPITVLAAMKPERHAYSASSRD